MKLTGRKALIVGAVAFVAAAGFASAAYAQAQGQDQDQRTPKGWSYEIRDGKRVPKGNRVTNGDGSWREEVRQGNCVTIKERSAAGEYKETRQCNGNPG
jgi:outer membrane usher protein FimD/PapC